MPRGGGGGRGGGGLRGGGSRFFGGGGPVLLGGLPSVWPVVVDDLEYYDEGLAAADALMSDALITPAAYGTVLVRGPAWNIRG